MRSSLMALTILSVAPDAAWAQGAMTGQLAPAIAGGCRADAAISDRGTISAKDLRKALFDVMISSQVKLTPEWMDGAGASPVDRLTSLAFTPGPDTPIVFDQLRHLTLTWLGREARPELYLPFERGGVRILNQDGSTVRAEARDVFAGILRGDSPYLLLCPKPSNGWATGTTGKGDGRGSLKFGVVRRPVDLGVADLVKRSYAEIAWVRDRDADESSYSIYGTFGLSSPDAKWYESDDPKARKSVTLRVQPTAFAQIEYEGGTSKGKPKQIDNLNFGLQLSGLAQSRSGATTSSNYFALNARYLSDTRLSSSGWAINGSVVPGIDLPAFDVPKRFGDDRFDFRWLVTIVADHVSISDPGTKAALVDAPSFTRAGTDLTGALRFFVDEGRKQSLTLSTDYYWREAIGRRIGDAQRLLLRLQFEPDPHVALGLAWDKGENLDSLEHSDIVRITLGLRH